jgi:hypothetical protein
MMSGGCRQLEGDGIARMAHAAAPTLTLLVGTGGLDFVRGHYRRHCCSSAIAPISLDKCAHPFNHGGWDRFNPEYARGDGCADHRNLRRLAEAVQRERGTCGQANSFSGMQTRD